MEKNQTYTVGVGGWCHEDGYPSPDITCGHKHRTSEAAERCGKKLYAEKVVGGNWQACATWHGWYVIVPHAEWAAAEFEDIPASWRD